MNQRKMKAVAGLLFFCLFLLSGNASWAEEFPIKPINLVIPYPPAGPRPDHEGAGQCRQETSRPAGHLREQGRGGGTVGPSLVVTRPPDGYTLGLITASRRSPTTWVS